MEGRFEILEEDIRDLDCGGFDLVLSNPPYHTVASGTLPKDPDNARARFEVDLDLAALLKTAKRSLSERGSFCLVYPEQRWTELVAAARHRGLVLEKWCRVQPTENTPSFLVVAAFRNRPDPEESVSPDPGPPLILETPGKEFGVALAEFVSLIANTCPTNSLLHKKASR